MGIARVLLLATALFFVSKPLAAHPPALLNSAAERAVAEEISAFRAEMVAAIGRKDARRLAEMYAPSFVHTPPAGSRLDREARIAAIVAGEAVIEGSRGRAVIIRIPNDWTAVVTGVSSEHTPSGSAAVEMRWTAVYVRTEKSWALAASQSGRLGGERP